MIQRGSICVISIITMCLVSIAFFGQQVTSANSRKCSSTPPGQLVQAVSDWTTDTIKEATSSEIINVRAKDPKGTSYNVTVTVNDGLQWTTKNKLKVFVLPHSHNDAGWGWTFEDYYELRTRHILDLMVKYMTEHPDYKLMWTEICFFDRWWRDQPELIRNRVKGLIENKQLEFVGGGWIMPDEAVVHYSSFITQLIEGHQWLKQRLDYSPKNGWAIDPFGLSPSLSLISKRSGLKSLTFVRTHYGVKRFLAERKSLEFNWRQYWGKGKTYCKSFVKLVIPPDANSNSDVFAHVMPYDSYDSGSTCGPDGAVCKDFGSEILGETLFNDSDIAYLDRRSRGLVEQFKKKSSLFQTNNVLYPVGGDFRFKLDVEWSSGLPHLKKVMDYVNSQDDLFTEMKLVTLDEYMSAVQEEMKVKKYIPNTIMGDFFTYDDKNDDYWSGYFTSRIFHKVTERRLMALTRASQLIFVMTTAEIYNHHGTVSFDFVTNLLEIIVECRRTLSLFQHHDGITGTSADPVVLDFAEKMDSAMAGANFVLQQCIFLLTHSNILASRRHMEDLKRQYLFTEALESRANFIKPMSRKVINVNESYPVEAISVFNPLQSRRIQLVRLVVPHREVKVTDSQGKLIHHELYPDYVFKYTQNPFEYVAGGWARFIYPGKPAVVQLNENQYELVFQVEIEPLSIKNFNVVYAPGNTTPQTVKTTVYKESNRDIDGKTKFTSKSKYFQVFNKNLKLDFEKNGMLKSVTCNNNDIPLNISFLAYETNSSGLYLFLPKGEAKELQLQSPEIVVVKGEMQSYVQIVYETVIHRIMLTNTPGIDSNVIEIQNLIDIRQKRNFELIMRISTNIQSENIFYTDSNGFQIMKREKLEGNPIQGNYYPVAATAFIEDDSTRLTLIGAQPGGGSSLRPGQLEIMLDRIVNQDDDRGIGQGGIDNLVVLSKFKILIEKPTACKRKQEQILVPALSLEAHYHKQNLLYPLEIFTRSLKEPSAFEDYSIPNSEPLLPCDVNVVGAFPLPEYDPTNDSDMNSIVGTYKPTPEFGLVIDRVAFDGRYDAGILVNTCSIDNVTMGLFRIADIFGSLIGGVMKRMSLTFTVTEDVVDSSHDFSMERMEIYSFLVPFRNSSVSS